MLQAVDGLTLCNPRRLIPKRLANEVHWCVIDACNPVRINRIEARLHSFEEPCMDLELAERDYGVVRAKRIIGHRGSADVVVGDGRMVSGH